MGVNEVFGPGTSFEDIIKRVKEIVLGTAV